MDVSLLLLFLVFIIESIIYVPGNMLLKDSDIWPLSWVEYLTTQAVFIDIY